MRRNIDGETTALLLIVMLIIICVLTGCSALPDTCQQGVPTNKNCLTVWGNKGAFGFGPINLVNRQF